jgi:hypothetical protein
MKFVLKFNIHHIFPKTLYLFGGMTSEKWCYCSNKCKLENDGGLKFDGQVLFYIGAGSTG